MTNFQFNLSDPNHPTRFSQHWKTITSLQNHFKKAFIFGYEKSYASHFSVQAKIRSWSLKQHLFIMQANHMEKKVIYREIDGIFFKS